MSGYGRILGLFYNHTKPSLDFYYNDATLMIYTPNIGQLAVRRWYYFYIAVRGANNYIFIYDTINQKIFQGTRNMNRTSNMNLAFGLNKWYYPICGQIFSISISHRYRVNWVSFVVPYSRKNFIVSYFSFGIRAGL